MANQEKAGPNPPVRRFPTRPHQLVERITPREKVFVLAPLGAPEVNADAWRLRIDGLVDRPIILQFSDLLEMPKRTMEAFHQCAGDPRAWDAPTRRITNVLWGGVDLAPLLKMAGVQPQARFVWSYGLDSGNYFATHVDAYLKDLPLHEVEDRGVLLAYELNGEPLTREHGFPLRLVVPGFYGTNAVKWLHHIQLADERAKSLFTTTLYNDPTPPTDAEPQGGTKPVWHVAPESVIVSPAPHTRIVAASFQIWGWAWSGADVAHVDVSTDGGVTWRHADLEPRTGVSWQKFSYSWHPDRNVREAILMSRATDRAGLTQPLSGARNAIHTVKTTIVHEPS
jgi:DMSO/TMAO reductase YedYZ molybdopterin-dependent catalytic subunit